MSRLRVWWARVALGLTALGLVLALGTAVLLRPGGERRVSQAKWSRAQYLTLAEVEALFGGPGQATQLERDPVDSAHYCLVYDGRRTQIKIPAARAEDPSVVHRHWRGYTCYYDFHFVNGVSRGSVGVITPQFQQANWVERQLERFDR